MSTRTVRETVIVTESLKNRFFSKTIETPSGCIIWTGAVSRNSYGKFRLSDGPQDTHVVSWRFVNGGVSVPIGKVVMHECDCRLCVNPEHLSLGNQSQNMLHAHENNRGDDFHLRGEEMVNAVITDEIALRLRQAYTMPNMSQRKVAAMFGIKYSVVRAVLEGRSWKHVAEAAR